MPRWRPPDFTRMLVGQHIVNGVSVGAGVLMIALAASAIFGFAAGQPATLGAISASISDMPSSWREKARTLSFGFALALISTSAIQLALPWPPVALATIGLIAFLSGMITGWGRWAVALGMQMLIPLVFVLGFPRETPAVALKIQALFALGGLVYIAFALLATIVTDASARRLVASETIRELAIYLRAVAAVFDPDADFEQAYGSAIRQQAMLSEQLQSARSALLDRPPPGSERMRLAATIGVLLDAFDALVAAQSEVTKVRAAPGSAPLLTQIGEALRVGALDLTHLSLEILTTDRPTLPPDHQRAIDAMRREAERQREPEAAHAEAWAALTAATERLALALGHIRRLERTLSDDRAAEAAIGGVDLAAFLPRRSYAWSTLRQHVRIASPVLRYSVRLALAMMAGAVVAQFLGDSGHGNWVLLTIAVVMRANYGLTKTRRDDRVIGTLIGCVVAAGAVAWAPAGVLVAVQGLAVVVIHSFVRLNYRLSSVGASVMALVSLHLIQPDLPAPIVARLADTLVGAAIAELFSFVWPSWEFVDAPGIARRLLARLASFTDVALNAAAPTQDYRLARKNVIEAIAALSDSAGRMSVEPVAARKGLEEMAALLMAAHGYIARLSAARLDIRAGAPPPDAQTRARLQRLLALKGGEAPPDAPEAAAPLVIAALAVVAAAGVYQRAARSGRDERKADA
ncbi:putative membrane protein YccC [Roseiarcus fermentans]|uniref:Putative membrane protein YccC n=1 Tax=Roseiarcus fermentans TaxID=1473586 RepID=A0A366FGL3_9HYPH|nr:FUSC family membrane protein [Roseiarcus fermentans]RBP13747.1 putative membrane protein YccC [Roseiarcus fermentans]